MYESNLHTIAPIVYGHDKWFIINKPTNIVVHSILDNRSKSSNRNIRTTCTV